jgi:hypothetical protein
MSRILTTPDQRRLRRRGTCLTALILAALSLAPSAFGQGVVCKQWDWNWGHCFIQLCRSASTAPNGAECVAFYHGVLEGAVGHATADRPVNICVPSTVKSAQVVEEIAGYMDQLAKEPVGIAAILYTGKPMLSWLRRKFPCS